MSGKKTSAVSSNSPSLVGAAALVGTENIGENVEEGVEEGVEGGAEGDGEEEWDFDNIGEGLDDLSFQVVMSATDFDMEVVNEATTIAMKMVGQARFDGQGLMLNKGSFVDPRIYSPQRPYRFKQADGREALGGIAQLGAHIQSLGGLGKLFKLLKFKASPEIVATLQSKDPKEAVKGLVQVFIYNKVHSAAVAAAMGARLRVAKSAARNLSHRGVRIHLPDAISAESKEITIGLPQTLEEMAERLSWGPEQAFFFGPLSRPKK